MITRNVAAGTVLIFNDLQKVGPSAAEPTPLVLRVSCYPIIHGRRLGVSAIPGLRSPRELLSSRRHLPSALCPLPIPCYGPLGWLGRSAVWKTFQHSLAQSLPCQTLSLQIFLFKPPAPLLFHHPSLLSPSGDTIHHTNGSSW